MTTHPPRLAWPDAAKGFCIFLVVLVHLTSKHYIALDWDLPTALSIGWSGFSRVFGPIRMPLFFAISGFFVAKYLTRKWGEIARKRIITTYYLYLVWFVLHTLYFSTSVPLSTNRPENLGGFLLGLVLGYTSLWYLYALPVYFAVAKICATRPIATLVISSIIALLAGANVFPSIGNTNSLLGNFVFFAAAAYFPHLLTSLSETPSFRRVVLSLSGFFVVSTALVAVNYAVGVAPLPIALTVSGAEIIASVIGLVAGVTTFSWIAHNFPGLTKPWVVIGRQTLPVYVLHLPLMALMNVALADVELPVAVLAVYPLVASALLVIACIGIYRILLMLRLGWAFSMPQKARTDVPPPALTEQIPARGVDLSTKDPTAR